MVCAAVGRDVPALGGVFLVTSSAPDQVGRAAGECGDRCLYVGAADSGEFAEDGSARGVALELVLFQQLISTTRWRNALEPQDSNRRIPSELRNSLRSLCRCG